LLVTLFGIQHREHGDKPQRARRAHRRITDDGKRKADFSVVLCDSLCPLCCAFENLTRRKATENTELSLIIAIEIFARRTHCWLRLHRAFGIDRDGARDCDWVGPGRTTGASRRPVDRCRHGCASSRAGDRHTDSHAQWPQSRHRCAAWERLPTDKSKVLRGRVVGAPGQIKSRGRQ